MESQSELASSAAEVLLPNAMPEAEYMYGCTATAMGMLLGYYDLYGYSNSSFSNLIEGTITVDSRGSDGDAYNMNEFSSVLGRFIASEEYVGRFFETTPETELEYTFVGGGVDSGISELNVSEWNCLADYLGTGQYWRGQTDYATCLFYATLERELASTNTITVSAGGVSRTMYSRDTGMMYGLYLYVNSRGYSLDAAKSGTFKVDGNGGSFTFEKYMAEIDAGRPVIVSIEGHSMIGYGYDADTREIIFDDTYRHDQRMSWNGSYYFSYANRPLTSISTVVFTVDAVDLNATYIPAGWSSALVISDTRGALTQTGSPDAQKELFVNFAVQNLGTTASGAFVAAVTVDGVTVSTVSILSVGAGEYVLERDISIGKLAQGSHRIAIVIDPDGKLTAETNRTNNVTEQILDVASATANYNRIIRGSSVTLENGQMTSTLIGSGGTLYVKNGGVAAQTDIGSGGIEIVSSGGSALNTSIMNGAQYVYSGGSASGTTLSGTSSTDFTKDSVQYVSGGTVIDTYLDRFSQQKVYGSANVVSTTIASGGMLDLGWTPGATIRDLVQESGGILSGYIGDQYQRTITGTNPDGDFSIIGSVASNCMIYGETAEDVYSLVGLSFGSGARAYHTQVLAAGQMWLNTGAISYNTRVWGDYSHQIINSGAKTYSAHLSSGGTQIISSGGSGVDTVVSSGGIEYVYYGGTADNTEVYDGGIQYLRVCNGTAGGITHFTRVSSGGRQYVGLQGNANDTVVCSGGSQIVLSGGTATDSVIEFGGRVFVSSGGQVDGDWKIGGRVAVQSGAILAQNVLLFDLAKPSGDSMLYFSDGSGPAANTVIQVDVSNAWGEYWLIEGDLSQIQSASITVNSGGEGKALTVGGMVSLADGRIVSLAAAESTLVLSVTGTDEMPPETPKLLEEKLTDNVLALSWTPVADFSGVSYQLEYSKNINFEDSQMQEAISNDISIVLPSGTWYWRMRAVDGAGNVSGWTAASEVAVDYARTISGTFTSTQSIQGDVVLADGATIRASYPAALQLMGNEISVTLAGNNTLSCSSIRNAAILFGDDAAWVDTYSYGPHWNGTVTFAGENITLDSKVSDCITAAGIVGNDLTLNFVGAASGAESIVFEATNGLNTAANRACGVKADGDLTINGDFGGTIYNHFDFSGAKYNRYGALHGFSSGDVLKVNGDLSGTIFLSCRNASGSAAYGLYAQEALVVSGEISGLIAVGAETNAYAIYSKKIDITVTGTIFAGRFEGVNDKDTILQKLAAFEANKTELLALAQDRYAVYATGTGNLRFSGNALVIGKIAVSSGSSILIEGNARLYTDVISSYSTGMKIVLSDAALEGIRVNTSTWNSLVSLTVDVSEVDSNGGYTLVGGANLGDLSRITLSSGTVSRTLSAGENVVLNGATYQFSKLISGAEQRAVLSVSGILPPDVIAPELNGGPSAVQNAGQYTATFTWRAALDNVGVAGYELKIGDAVFRTAALSYRCGELAVGAHEYQLRAYDASGNYSGWSTVKTLNVLDVTAPTIESISADQTAFTNQPVTVTAVFADNGTLLHKQYKIDDGQWLDYGDGVTVTANATIYFQAVDDNQNTATAQYVVSNIDTTAPEMPANFKDYGRGNGIFVEWSAAADEGGSGIAGYHLRYANAEALSGDGEFLTVCGKQFGDLATGDWFYQVRSVDAGGNVSEWSPTQTFRVRRDNSDDWTNFKSVGGKGDVGDLGTVKAAGTLVSDGWVGF
ncbi:MAG: AIDA repeat-containing protein, partial [Victivallaceae bacterium]|nr:AIDA repeat-containing protein [Victivallaceae bacterium]